MTLALRFTCDALNCDAYVATVAGVVEGDTWALWSPGMGRHEPNGGYVDMAFQLPDGWTGVRSGLMDASKVYCPAHATEESRG